MFVSSAIVILMIYTKNVNIDISILYQLRDLMCTQDFYLGNLKSEMTRIQNYEKEFCEKKRENEFTKFIINPLISLTYNAYYMIFQ